MEIIKVLGRTYITHAAKKIVAFFQICEHRDKHVDAVKMRAQEEKWEAINCYNKSGIERSILKVQILP